MKLSRKPMRLLLVLVAMMLACSLLLTGCFFNNDDDDDDDDGKSKGESKQELAAQSEFIKGLGGVSETFKGQTSAMSYSTFDEAATAFVEEEVAGNADVSIDSIDHKGELDDDEIEALAIPDEDLEGAIGVEEIVIKYSDSIVQTASDKLDKTKTVKVYIIKYENSFKYYAPAPVTGATITKSYYDSVFNADKYKNCTFKNTMEMEISMYASAEGQTIDFDATMTMEQLIKFTDGKIYLEQTMKTVGEGDSAEMMGFDNEEQYIAAYIEVVDGYTHCYVKTEKDGSWALGNLYQIGFGNINELTPFHDQYLDYSYFTKTDYGFQVSGDNAKKFIEETLSHQAGFGSDMFDMMDIDMFAKYYVCDGTLSGMREDVTLKIDSKQEIDGVEATIKLDEYVKVETTCKDYGSTVVEKPFTE